MQQTPSTTANKTIIVIGMRMHVSYEQAALWFNISNGILVIALILGVIATYAMYVLGNIKEEFVNENIAQSHERSAKLESEAATSKERTAVVERGNIELQINLEKERSARLELEAKIAPRRLSESDKKALIAALKPFAGQKCLISYSLGSAESDTYSDDFVKVVDAAGWDHNGLNGIFGSVRSAVVTGVQIAVHPDSDRGGGIVTPGILALIKSARKLGLTEGPHEFYTDPGIPAGVVEIRVGTK
ncbi:MAG: hypothetical protein U1E51_03220 [Candidatus Binatia bacterium]|nr:hypothetical protein [Candidatus Binatia bacterium]